MAELRNALSAVEALEAQVAILRGFADAHDAGEEVLERMQVELQSVLSAVEGETHGVMEKFRERTKMVDPVTNEPRFGPKTMAKVQDMLGRYDAIYQVVTDGDLVPSLRAHLDAARNEKAAEAKRMEEEEQRRRSELEAQRQREEEELKRMEQARLAQLQREQEAEQQRVAELARLAQLKREERERQRLVEEAKAKKEQERLERQNATAQVGVEGLKMAVEEIRRSVEPVQFRQTLQKLHVLVANICSSPENSSYRHVPKDNAHFHQDIGQFEGGHASLLAMGFKELEPEPGKRVFIMEEPDLSEDLDKWSAWFDGLKEMKEWLETQQ